MNMEITVTGRNDIAFTDKNLQNATMRIFQLNETIRKNYFAIAAVVAMVSESECYKADGFNDVHAWVTRTFGYKKSMSYDLLKIGREYTRELLNKAGKPMGYECNLLPADSDDNFRTTQVMKMLPLGHTLAEQLVEEGKIKPDMTVRAISEVVKEYSMTDDKPESDNDKPESDNDVDVPPEVEAEQAPMIERFTDGELIDELVKRGYIISKGEQVWGC